MKPTSMSGTSIPHTPFLGQAQGSVCMNLIWKTIDVADTYASTAGLSRTIGGGGASGYLFFLNKDH